MQEGTYSVCCEKRRKKRKAEKKTSTRLSPSDPLSHESIGFSFFKKKNRNKKDLSSTRLSPSDPLSHERIAKSHRASDSAGIGCFLVKLFLIIVFMIGTHYENALLITNSAGIGCLYLFIMIFFPNYCFHVRYTFYEKTLLQHMLLNAPLKKLHAYPIHTQKNI